MRSAIQSVWYSSHGTGFGRHSGAPVTGLTRDALRARLAVAGAPAELQARVARIQDSCDEVRFAPGAARMDRAAVLADAEALAAGWGEA